MGIKETAAKLTPEQAKKALISLADRVDGVPDGKFSRSDLGHRVEAALYDKVTTGGKAKILAKVTGLLVIGFLLGLWAGHAWFR
jgi:hypothetical protein